MKFYAVKRKDTHQWWYAERSYPIERQLRERSIKSSVLIRENTDTMHIGTGLGDLFIKRSYLYLILDGEFLSVLRLKGEHDIELVDAPSLVCRCEYSMEWIVHEDL